MESPEVIKTLTAELEHGQSAGLTNNFHGKFEEERIATLKLIGQQNESNRQEHPEIPKLEIETRTSPGWNHESVRLNHGTASESFWGAKQIYSSTLELRNLERSGGEAIPPNRTNIDVEALTERLERGDGVGTKNLISPLFEEERVRVFRQVQQINEQHLADHKTNVHLYSEISASKTGTDYISVERRMPGLSDDFWGGVRIYNESLDLHTLERKVWEKQDERR